jgi:hypothetical protein
MNNTVAGSNSGKQNRQLIVSFNLTYPQADFISSSFFKIYEIIAEKLCRYNATMRLMTFCSEKGSKKSAKHFFYLPVWSPAPLIIADCRMNSAALLCLVSLPFPPGHAEIGQNTLKTTIGHYALSKWGIPPTPLMAQGTPHCITPKIRPGNILF